MRQQNTPMPWQLEIRAQQKPHADCLSHFQIAQLATGDLTADEVTAAHLQRCDSCSEQLHSEQSLGREFVAGAPAWHRAAVAAAQESPPLWRAIRQWAFLPAFAAAASLLLWLNPPKTTDDGNLTKGRPFLIGTVMRDGDIVVQEQALDTFPKLMPGDRLRLRVADPSAPFVSLQGTEEGRWAAYYTGKISADGWLPVGVKITDSGRTRLRLVVCASTQAEPAVEGTSLPSGCTESVFELSE